MQNPQRGDITATLNGKRRTLRLTLGALAELEAALDSPDLVALATRLETGALSAAEIAAIIGAGLRGAGETVSDADVKGMTIEGGATGALRIAADLLTAGFAP